ncbi:hypothetical protein [Paraburkholderia azotifigens]|uniref:hypothetical protein n=1 Tax=Paraburkholderia azotifigens TaxID=2057004 RepID=UPI0038B8AB9D
MEEQSNVDAGTSEDVLEDARAQEIEAGEPVLDIIAEIEHLVRITGNAAVYEHNRIVQRLADLKNHPQIKAGE